MNTVYIIFSNGEVTTIKSKIALTIATGFLDKWFDLRDFKCILDSKNKTFYLVSTDCKIDLVNERR